MRSERDAILSLQRFFGQLLPEPWDVRTELEAGEAPERPFALVEQAGAASTSGALAMQEVTLPMTVNLYLARGDSPEDATDHATQLRELVWQAVKWGDPARPTTDRLPLWAYEPRVEKHRVKVTATGGTWTYAIGSHVAAGIPFDVAEAVLAAELTAAIGAGPGDISVVKRGAGLWDVAFAGELAGVRVGDPDVDDAALTGPFAAATAKTLLEGAEAPWRGPSDYMRVVSFSQNTVRDQSDPSLVMVPVDLRLTFVRGAPLPFGRPILQGVTATPGN